MAYADARFGYHQVQADSALDSKRAAFIDDDDSAILDPSILDAEIMHSPINDSFRKASFANSNGVLSPADSQVWDHPFNNAGPGSTGASNHFHEDGNAFMRQSNQHPQSYAPQHHPPSWSFENGSGNCTPPTGVEFMPPPAQFDASQYQRTDSVHGSFSQAPGPPPQFNVTHPDAGFIPAPQVQTPMSPHSHQDWMGMAQQEMEGRPSHKRMRRDSPPRTVIDLQRRDGIRKKNGRIDIPHENIGIIDDLIEKTTDDDVLKELKQQKRLLRNREAALASRQRKKKHTEDLEIKEKSYTQQISMLESRVNELSLEREHRDRDRQMIIHRLEEANRIIELMQDEKRDLIMRHNEEASSLRKRVHILSEQLETGPVPMSAVPSSTGYTDFSAEMEALNMGPHDWDSFIHASNLQNDSQDNSFGFEPRAQPAKPAPVLEKKPSAVATVQPSKKPQESVSDQPIASGLLFMLLLCGAFVASKPASSQPQDLPNMPPDVRAAAPTVLSNLLSEANHMSGSDATHVSARMGQEPMPSGVAFNNNHKPTRMDRMHRAITSPTKQQEIDQAFALTPTQYASMTGADFSTYDQPPPPIQGDSAPPQRRILAEALANLEHQHARSSKAEVYTRSLLWDQIPADVVRQFRKIVRDNKDIEARQQQRRPSHEFSYKLEQ